MPVGLYISVKNGSQGLIPCFDLIQISRSHCCGHFITEQRIFSGGHWLYVPKCYCTDRLSKIGKTSVVSQVGFPAGASGKESACQRGRHERHGFDPCVQEILLSRKWQPTPVFLPGKFCGQRSLVGYSPRGPIESDTTEQACKPQWFLVMLIRKAQSIGSWDWNHLLNPIYPRTC